MANSDNTSGYYIIRQNDFVYNPRKSSDAPYGPISSYKYAEDGIVSPLYLCFHAKDEINPLYYEWYFRSSAWHRYIYMSGDSGARHDRVSIKDDTFFAMPINLPSEQEQSKIASFLQSLDERIAAQEKLVASLKKYKRGLLMHFFSDDTTRQWRQYTISQIGKVITGNTPPTNDRSNYDGDLMFCSPRDIGEQKYISSTEKRVSPKGFALGRPIPPSSVIVTCIGLIGKLGIATTDMITNQQINALIVSEDFDHEFIYYAFENFFPKYRSKVSMQTLPILSKSEFEKLLIKVPNLNVQHKISNYLAGMDKRIEQTQQELNVIQDLRRGIIQKLFI
ncbi:MAG TPA: restriction endonuclease subunit S [Oscillospiraceae bacterium]|nr:restriction endonuclease subunit S [Oscillospiraceae bacterium]